MEINSLKHLYEETQPSEWSKKWGEEKDRVSPKKTEERRWKIRSKYKLRAYRGSKKPKFTSWKD